MDLLQELTCPSNYSVLFERLRKKARQSPRRRNSHPVCRHLSLNWILNNEALVTRQLVREIRARNYQPLPCTRSEVLLDKRRLLYSLSWPDRIVENLTADLLQRALEPLFSDRLFSFRKGRSNYLAVQDVGGYLRTARQNQKPLY